MKQSISKPSAKKFWRGEIRSEIASQFGLSIPKHDGERMLSPNDAAEMLGITGEAVKQWIYHRRLPAVKLANGYWKIKASDLQKYIDERYTGPDRPIVVASTDPDTVSVFSHTLKEIGIDVHETGNLLDALLKASSLSPAAIIVDLSSFKDAWRFLAKLKAESTLEKIPILLITSEVLNAEQMNKALDLRVGACIEKPIQRETIIRESKLLMGVA